MENLFILSDFHKVLRVKKCKVTTYITGCFHCSNPMWYYNSCSMTLQLLILSKLCAFAGVSG